MGSAYLYEMIQRVPPITDDEIASMRRIEPVLKMPNGMYKRIEGADKLHPRNVSCLWDAKPIGEEFSFGTLDRCLIITQHHSAVFFKPSLAEVYAWIRVYMPTTWEKVRYFCLVESFRIDSSSDFGCYCEIMGGDMLVKGREIIFPSREVGHELIKKPNDSVIP